MKLVDSEKTIEGIRKMSLVEKQKRILEIQKTGFLYDDKEIKEIIKDKWVFIQNDSETDIEDIDYVLLNWAEEEELRIEKEEAEKGDTVVHRYFKKYGILSVKEKPKGETLYGQTIYFDGKACPGHTWNTELSMYRLGVYKSYENHYDNNTASYVKFYADMYIENLMDAKMKGNEPTLRHCHDWHTSPHKKADNHYKYDNWLEDIQTAKNAFKKEVDKLTKGCESFNYNSKTGIYCVPEKFVFWIEEEADHNGDETSFFRSNIYGTNKYKGSEFRNTKKVPTKFDKVVSRGELIEIAMKHIEDKLSKHNFRQEFKY